MNESARSQILDVVERLVQERITPRASHIDATGEFPADLYKEIGNVGLFGLWIPEEYGGTGPDIETPLLISERIARVSASFAVIYSNCGDACTPIVHAASEKLKREYLPGIAEGKLIPCFALSEPGAGSDAASIVTAARRDGDQYVVNGRKAWCTNGAVGDVYVVFAKTAPELGNKGISAFVVPRDTPGFSRGANEQLIGLRGSPTTELIFENARIPAGNLLGNEGDGFKIAMMTMDEARLNCAAMALGAARGALSCAVDYARERVQFGKAIIEHQGLQFMLAEMTAELAAARCLWEKAIGLLTQEKSQKASTFAAMAKLVATDFATRATAASVQAMGANGLSKAYLAERMMRDVKAFEIFDGTNEIQKLLIGRHLRREGLPFS